MTGALRRSLRRRFRSGSPGSANPRLIAFVRGAVLGALVGAAIAGSTIWRRSRRRV